MARNPDPLSVEMLTYTEHPPNPIRLLDGSGFAGSPPLPPVFHGAVDYGPVEWDLTKVLLALASNEPGGFSYEDIEYIADMRGESVRAAVLMLSAMKEIKRHRTGTWVLSQEETAVLARTARLEAQSWLAGPRAKSPVAAVVDEIRQVIA